MPGHNGSGSIPLHYDVTELPGTDILHAPAGIIKDAQLNAGVAFGALHTFFLVNGSSVGLHALVMAACRRGDTLIVDRSCHISVINALVLNDIKPVYVYPRFNAEFGINGAIDPADISDAYTQNPLAKGVLLTSPSYYGVCADLAAIAEITHSFGGVLLVDEAHGAHFAFGDCMPRTALYCGADGIVQSVHKTLPCITQGAVLHLGSGRIRAEAIGDALKMLQTTSPSYLIMMSIDNAVCEMQRNGRALLAKTVRRCEALRRKLNASGKFKCFESDDPTRLVIFAGKSAAAVERKLRTLHHIGVEMCDGANLVLIAKAATKGSDFDRLDAALSGIASGLPPLEALRFDPPPRTSAPMSPAEAYYAGFVEAAPKDAVGRIAARAVYRTPPCMGIVVPGELITGEIAALADSSFFVL